MALLFVRGYACCDIAADALRAAALGRPVIVLECVSGVARGQQIGGRLMGPFRSAL